MNVKKECERLELNYSNVISYKIYHPELTYEQVFEYYMHKKYREPLRKICKRLELNYEQVRGFKKAHKELSIDEIIQLFTSGKQKEYTRYKRINRNKEKKNTKIKEKAYRARTNIFVKDNKFRNLHDMIRYYNIEDKYEAIRKYLRNHPEKTYEDVLKLYGADIPRRTREEIILIQNKHIEVYNNLKAICKRLCIDYESVKKYKNKHDANYAQCIIRYRPDCYINIFGEIVDPTQN